MKPFEIPEVWDRAQWSWVLACKYAKQFRWFSPGYLQRKLWIAFEEYTRLDRREIAK